MSCLVTITGGDGFLGRAVTKELTKRGHSCAVLDITTGVDILDATSVRSNIVGCDHVIHLAGLLGTNELFSTPYEAVDVNIKGSLNVMLACRDLGVGYTSIQMPNTAWCNIYQSTKFCAENIAMAYNKYQGLKASFVCAYSGFGEQQKVRGVQKFLPTFATRAWRNQPLPIWGSGEQTLDMVYSSDIARVLVDAMAYKNGEHFDAGTGVPTTVNKVAKMVIEITGSTAGVEHFPMRNGEVEDGVPPIAVGRGWDLLGYKPEFRMEDFIRTVEWYREDRP
jgi:UDP-glucose 4-epimerase